VHNQTNTVAASRVREKQRAELLSRVIDNIGQADFLADLLAYLRFDIPFFGVLLVLLDERKRMYHIYDTVQTAYRTNLDMYLDGVYQLDPFYAHFCNNRNSAAMLIRDVAPDRFYQTEYHRRYYRNIELLDEMAIFNDLRDGRFLFFSLSRRAQETRFRRRELDTIQCSLPLLESLCRQHFGSSSYSQENLSGKAEEQRLEYALERFGEPSLTPREHEVAVSILKGHSSKSLAREIDISPETVKIHRRNIYRKLIISSQSELFVKFLNTLG
jgi:DNA-binding CsgD family transcriptional regulator